MSGPLSAWEAKYPWLAVAFIGLGLVAIYGVLALLELVWLAVKAKVVAWAVLS